MPINMNPVKIQFNKKYKKESCVYLTFSEIKNLHAIYSFIKKNYPEKKSFTMGELVKGAIKDKKEACIGENAVRRMMYACFGSERLRVCQVGGARIIWATPKLKKILKLEGGEEDG